MEDLELSKGKFTNFINDTKRLFTTKTILIILLGTGILSFGIYNIHQQADVTEGGVLGMILLIEHWLGIPPSIISPILDIICYVIAFKFLGSDFIKISVVSSISLSFFFWVWERFPPMLPNLSSNPFLASILGGIFVGGGVGLIVRQGGSSGGDDALALCISKITKCRISKAYLATDITVLILSLSYIPLKRIVFSFVTVIISSYLIDIIERVNKKTKVEKTKVEKTKVASKSTSN